MARFTNIKECIKIYPSICQNFITKDRWFRRTFQTIAKDLVIKEKRRH